MRGWRMPQQAEAKVHVHWVLHYPPTLGLTGIHPGRWRAWPVMAPPPQWPRPRPRASRLTWPARRSRDPSRRRHLGATAEEGSSRGKEREKSQERGGRRRGRGHGRVPAGQRRLAEAAARRLTAGTEPRAAPPLERRGPCAASPVTPASSSPVTPAALPRTGAPRPRFHCRPSAGPVATPRARRAAGGGGPLLLRPRWGGFCFLRRETASPSLDGA